MKNKHGISLGFLFFFLPVALWLTLLIVLPHLELLRLSFTSTTHEGLTLVNYMAFFTEPIYWLTFVRTAAYSILVTFLVMVIALPVSFYITKVARVRTGGFLMMLVLVPFWVSELIRVYGWIILLRESGALKIPEFLIGAEVREPLIAVAGESAYAGASFKCLFRAPRYKVDSAPHSIGPVQDGRKTF